MKILLDTHVFLWWITDSPRLSFKARQIFEEGSNHLLLSTASAWEIAIKSNIGKIVLTQPIESFVPDQLIQNAIEVLPVKLDHALRVAGLPTHHKDPFDRLLVAQAMVEDLPILTGDSLMKAYSIKTIW